MFDWLTGALAKYALIGCIAIMAAGGTYLGWTKYQLSRAETKIAKQEDAIKTLNGLVISINFDRATQDEVIDALEERLSQQQIEIENLNDEVSEILARPKEDDGDVAPVLRDTL